MEKLRQDIRANQFERVYLLYGEERYLVQMYKNQLKKAIIGDDTMNLNQYTGKGLPVQEVENAVMTMPFFADRRLVLLEDTGLFKSSDEQWSNLVKTIPDSCHVLFVEQEVDKRSRMYKAVMWLLRRDDASFNAAAYTVDFKGIWALWVKNHTVCT